jgi:mRNA interferase RelE/StbE
LWEVVLTGPDTWGDLAGLWRYRVGDYRIICEIQDERVVVLALAVGHRREVYSRGT